MENNSLIYSRGLVKTYQVGAFKIQALRGIDLTVNRGELLAIMGVSGSGKSTLMNVLGCMDRPTGGSYLLDGIDVGLLDRHRTAALRNKKIGFVFQRYNLLSRASALANVMLPLQYAGIDGPAAEEKARAVLARVGLADYAAHIPGQMSGGQQQRVAIARAVVNDPLVIFADEPTGALDTATSREVMDLLLEVHAERGATLVIVTHEQEIAAYCRRLVRLRDGLIIEDTPLTAKRCRPLNLLTYSHGGVFIRGL
ncbi:MAG: ABC transporter ATP-binding protein [Eubacteriales bacterium]